MSVLQCRQTTSIMKHQLPCLTASTEVARRTSYKATDVRKAMVVVVLLLQ